MKILFLFTFNQGLLSNFFIELGQKLIEDKHEVKIFSLKKHPSKLRVGDIEITIETKGGYLNNYYRIFKYIRMASPDVIITNFSYDNPGLLAGKLLNIKKKIVWSHSLKVHGDPSKYKIILKKHFYKIADSVIVNSVILENELKKVFKVNHSKITPIPFWSNIEDINISPIKLEKTIGKVLIGCPGRFTLIKNQRVIIDAFSVLKENKRAIVEVYFAGEGPSRDEIEKQVNRLGLKNQVSFLGVLSAGEMKDFYQKMDVVILPSLYESFGLVFIETISLGTPVLVSSEFGALDFINKDSDRMKKIIFDPRNFLDLADKLQNILENHNCIDNYNVFKNMYLDNFNKDIIYKKIIKVLSN